MKYLFLIMSMGVSLVANGETFQREDSSGAITYLGERCETGSKERRVSSIYKEATDIPTSGEFKRFVYPSDPPFALKVNTKTIIAMQGKQAWESA